jgi:hypothetical protein
MQWCAQSIHVRHYHTLTGISTSTPPILQLPTLNQLLQKYSHIKNCCNFFRRLALAWHWYVSFSIPWVTGTARLSLKVERIVLIEWSYKMRFSLNSSEIKSVHFVFALVVFELFSFLVLFYEILVLIKLFPESLTLRL